MKQPWQQQATILPVKPITPVKVLQPPQTSQTFNTNTQPTPNFTTTPATPPTPAVPQKTERDQPANTTNKSGSNNQLDYQTSDEVRMQQIQQNLTQYGQTSPEMFKDRTSFESNFQYGGRSKEQKQVLDNFYKDYSLKQGNPDTVYQTLMWWGQVPWQHQNTEWFKQWFAKFQKIGMFSSMDAKSLARQIGTWIIVGGAERQELAKMNPQLAQDALMESRSIQAEKIVNGTNFSYEWIDENRIPEVDVLIKALTKQMENLQSLDINLAEEYKTTVMEDPQINELYSNISTKSKKINELQATMEKSIEDAYWSAWGASDSVIRARANQTYGAIQRQIWLAQWDIAVDQWMLDTLVKQKTDYYSTKIDEYNQNVSLTKDTNTLLGQAAQTISGAYKWQRETKEAQEKSKIQQEYDMAKAQAQQEYQMTRDNQAYQRDISMADRKYEQDLGMSRMKYQNDLEMTGYKSDLDLRNNKTLEEIKASNDFGLEKLKQSKNNNWPSSITTPVSQQSTDFLSMADGTKWWQCGFYANRAVWLNGEPWWDDTVAGRTKTYTDKTPRVWGLVFFWPWSWLGNAKNGHVAVVSSIEGWMMTIKQSNADGKSETVSTQTISIGTATWFYNNTPLAKAQSVGVVNSTEPVFKNETQSKSFEYANRMIPSIMILDNLESTWLNKDARTKLNSNKLAPDFLESTEYQQYDQARRDFINAVLRKESGAVISDQEFKNAEKQYFVQPWDKAEVIAQKQKNRVRALEWFMSTSWNKEYLQASMDVEKQYKEEATQTTGWWRRNK